MTSRGFLPPAIAGLLLVLTYLLVQATTPDPVLHERTLDALRRLILGDAALQRDVVRARAGFLRNYDPLTHSVVDLREAAGTLKATGRSGGEEAGAELGRRVRAIDRAVQEQEDALEAFKSSNALLHNSLTFFSHVTSEGGQTGHASEIGRLAIAMLRFTSEPVPGAADAVEASLARVSQLPDALESMRALVAHGQLIVNTLPAVDDLVERVQRHDIAGRTRSFQDLYLDWYGRAAERAGVFRILLYAASVALVIYLARLFVRLRSNARILERRLAFENVIASISTEFINLPRERMGDGVQAGLGRLAEHAGVDRASIVLCDVDGTRVEGGYVWRREGIREAPGTLDDVLDVATGWSVPGYEHEGGIEVPEVRALPDGPDKSKLESAGIRTWLCIPMWRSGRRIGFLTLDMVAHEARCPDGDFALFRMAAEIFANAIERERSEAEREALEGRLNQAQRLQAIGTLAGGIAHEFNNILGAILGYSEMALAAVGRNAAARGHLEQVMKAGGRAQGVIDQILTFGRRTEHRSRPIEAEAVVSEAIDLLRVSLPATLTVQANLDADGATMVGDPTQIHQVVMNLGTNASHAMGGRGTLEISLDAVAFDHDVTLSHGRLSAGRYIRLIVTDTGHGMDPATLERIFEPFFTTKAAGSGTGLGLPTVHGIVTGHAGALDVRSRPGRGATFEVYFPATERPATPEDKTVRAAPHGHGETILLVDDERQLLLLGEEMLAALGYEAVGFDGSRAALAAFRADPDRFDLVLTDEVMPEMTGTELATALHRLRPGLPILLMTGYAGEIRSRSMQEAGIREILKKPILSTPLADCLARNLREPARAGMPFS